MPDFHKYLMRHGEHGVQAIIEQIERREGIKSREGASLEDRWQALVQSAPVQPSSLAA